MSDMKQKYDYFKNVDAVYAVLYRVHKESNRVEYWSPAILDWEDSTECQKPRQRQQLVTPDLVPISAEEAIEVLSNVVRKARS